MEKKSLFSFILIAVGFWFFVTRDQTFNLAQDADPEDVVILMMQAMKGGEVEDLLESFGGELRQRLHAIVQREGKSALTQWLKERGKLAKGFAIVKKEFQAPDTVVIHTETVYQDRNTRQRFLVQQEKGSWKITDSDFEMVSNWETSFGKPIWEEQP